MKRERERARGRESAREGERARQMVGVSASSSLFFALSLSLFKCVCERAEWGVCLRQNREKEQKIKRMRESEMVCVSASK